MPKLPKQVRAFVTGGGSGLGRALALHLAKHKKARLLIGDIDADGAAETVRLARAAGGEAEAVTCDVTDVAQVEAASARAAELWDGVDLVINNAGVAAAGPVGEQSLEDWKWITGINQWGVIHGCHVFVPQFKAAGRGWVLNVASSAGIATIPEMGSYNVTKAAVIALSETLYAELKPHGVGVTVLCPTFFPTNLMSSFRSPQERQRKLANALFKRSKTTAEKVAATAIGDLEKGRLMCIPQADGKLIWRAKRALYQRYYDQVARGYNSRVLDRMAK